MAPRKRKRIHEERDEEGKCILCFRSENNEFAFGELLSFDNKRFHYYCLLFACGLGQNGEDDEGILGFLIEDIIKETRRGSRLKCRFCGIHGATSACAISKCKVTFHLPCGLENNTLHQFFGDFSSYCVTHRPYQKEVLTYRTMLAANRECAICLETINPKKPYFKELLTPCCKRWFHRDCVQRQALSAGYFFKCPLCNNSTEFLKEMRTYGIYAPEKDASWELESNAFQELAFRYSQCDAQVCSCPGGRKYEETETKWDIVVCEFCASQGTHVKCGNVSEEDLQTWTCATCSVAKKIVRNKENRLKPTRTDNDSASSSGCSSSSSFNNYYERNNDVQDSSDDDVSNQPIDLTANCDRIGLDIKYAITID